MLVELLLCYLFSQGAIEKILNSITNFFNANFMFSVMSSNAWPLYNKRYIITFHFLTWAQYIHYFTETFLDESENGFEYLAILSLTRKFTLSMLSAQFGILWNSPENDLLTSQWFLQILNFFLFIVHCLLFLNLIYFDSLCLF